LNCDSGMALSLYLYNKNSLTVEEISKNYNIYEIGGRYPFEYQVSGNILCMKLSSISALDWDRVYKFVVKNKKTYATQTISYSPMIYAKEAMSSQNVKLKKLCKAVYLYNCAAKDYTGRQATVEYTRYDVPYVSTYYFNPKPTTQDNIEIPLYITDYEQSEYLYNDDSVRLDIIYEVDGVKKTISDVKLGDYPLQLGKLSAGMHTFTVQTLDKRTGLTSHKLYNELWVVESNEIPANKIYQMTAGDLTKYNINNNDSTDANDLVSTRDGLTKLFADLQKEGYKKIILYNNPNDKNIYRIDGKQARYTCITIPSYFTVDMNGCTFKMNTFTEDTSGCIVFMDDAVDAHLENGILEGNRYERKEAGVECNGQGEGINTVLIKGGKYCSIKNMTIRNTTGHTIYTESVMAPYYLLDGYTHTAVINGVEVADSGCSTSKMMDLQGIIDWDTNEDYLFVGHKGGYKGLRSEAQIYYISFYDANKNFLETVTGFQYRKMAIPQGARYAKVTFLAEEFPDTGYDGINIYVTHLGDYHEISNIKFENTRTCALAPTSCNNILIENVTYTNCADSITPVPVDFEDGWEECQDLYYRNNTVISKAEHTTGTVVDNAGFNHVYENCTNHQIGINGRLIGAVIRNMNDRATTLTWDMGSELTNNFSRIYDNTCGSIHPISQGGAGRSIDFKVKNCTIYTDKEVASDLLAPADKVLYEGCTFPCFAGTKATFVDCKIQPTDYLKDELYFYGCTFEALDGSGAITLNFWSPQSGKRVFENCTFKGSVTLSEIHSGSFKSCKFDDLYVKAGVDESDREIIFEDCTINSSAENFVYVGREAYSAEYINIQFKNCAITHTGDNLIGIFSFPNKDSLILFENCTINKTNGSLLKWILNYNRAANMNKISIDIEFKGGDVDSSLAIDNTVPDTYARVIFSD